jgi:hypothetical protein
MLANETTFQNHAILATTLQAQHALKTFPTAPVADTETYRVT